MSDTTKEHIHNYVAEKYVVQKEFSTYQSSGKYYNGIKEVQHVLIFCTKCGDRKEMTKDTADV